MTPKNLVLLFVLLQTMRTFSTTQLNLTFVKDNIMERDIANFSCYSSDDETNNNAKQFILWKSGINESIFEANKTCEGGQFNTSKDTTGGRITYETSQSILIKILTLNDTGSYACSLVRCSPEETVVTSNYAALTVHRLNRTPTLTVENNETAVFENNTLTLKMTCSGFVGIPPGVMNLVYFNSSGLETYVKENMTYDAEGNAVETVSYTSVFYGRPQTEYFYCETTKSVDNSGFYTYKSRAYLVPVQYAPKYAEIKCYYEEQELDNSGNTCFLQKPGNYTVKCSFKSNPQSTVSFKQVAGPTDIVQGIDSNTFLVTVEPNSLEKRVTLSCIGTYQSTLEPVYNNEVSGTLQLVTNPSSTDLPTSAITSPNGATSSEAPLPSTAATSETSLPSTTATSETHLPTTTTTSAGLISKPYYLLHCATLVAVMLFLR